MNARFFNIGIPEWLLLQCYEIAKSRSIHVEDMEPIEVFLMTFEDIIKRLESGGKIVRYSEADEDTISEMLNEWIGDAGLPEIELPPEPEESDPLSFILDAFSDGDNQYDSSVKAQTEAALEDGLSSSADPPIKPQIENRSENERNLDEQANKFNIDPSKPPWQQEGVLPFDKIAEQSPKDSLVEAAKEADNIPQKRAIECVYSNIPMEMWGGETAQRLVSDMIPTIDLYIKAIQGEL